MQAKLAVTEPGDVLEQEADRVADEVMRAPDALTPISLVQSRAQPATESGSRIAPQFAANLQKRRNAGGPLAPQTRQFFEARFGADFSDVRLHTDMAAGAMAQSINARAFTYGPNIYFAPGAYDDSSSSGRKLLAHELTHAVQQGRGQPQIARDGPRVADMTYEQRLHEALVAALPAFGTWLAVSIGILVLFAALIYAAVSWLLSLVPPAWAAWISATLGVIGVLMGIGFFVSAVQRGSNAWSEFDREIRNATTHEQLERAGERFGQEMAIVVTEIIAAVLSVVGGARGILGGIRGLRPPPPNAPVTAPPPTPPPPAPVVAAPRAAPRVPAMEPPVAEPPIAEPIAPEAPVAQPPVSGRPGPRVPAGRASLTRDEMRRLLQQLWNQNPLLQRLASARALSGARLLEELRAILAAFEAETGVIVEEVANGVVQAVRGAGNLASLRSSPGRLQIEAQVFENPQLLLTEITHELAYYYSRGAAEVLPLLGEGPASAMTLLEGMIETGGNLARVLP